MLGVLLPPCGSMHRARMTYKQLTQTAPTRPKTENARTNKSLFEAQTASSPERSALRRGFVINPPPSSLDS